MKLVEPGYPADNKVQILSGLDRQWWQALLAEAERQSVTPFLYAALARLEREHSLDFPNRDKLYQSYVINAGRNTLIMHDAEILLSSLKKAGIAAVGLKGVYLLENVYENIGARSMNDIDILVKKQDLAGAMEVFKGLGYQATTYFDLDDENVDTKHVPPMQKAGGALVEVHWTLLEEDEPFTIDAAALWERVEPAAIAGVEALTLGIEDLILHLSLHLTYQHYLQLGLRGLLDIALVIDKFKEEIDWQLLVQIAKTWGAERVTAITLKLVETQLKVPIPPEVYGGLLPEPLSPDLLENARGVLLDRERLMSLTPDLVEMNASKSVFSKLRIGLERIFIPRIDLARIYNVPPDSPKVFGFYWVRLKYLFRNYWGTVRRLWSDRHSSQPALEKAKTSYSLHDWMSER